LPRESDNPIKQRAKLRLTHVAGANESSRSRAAAYDSTLNTLPSAKQKLLAQARRAQSALCSQLMP